MQKDWPIVHWDVPLNELKFDVLPLADRITAQKLLDEIYTHFSLYISKNP